MSEKTVHFRAGNLTTIAIAATQQDPPCQASQRGGTAPEDVLRETSTAAAPDAERRADARGEWRIGLLWVSVRIPV